MTIDDKGHHRDGHNQVPDGDDSQENVMCPPQMRALLDGGQEQGVAHDTGQNDDQVEDDVAPIGIVIGVNVAISHLIWPIRHFATSSGFPQV